MSSRVAALSGNGAELRKGLLSLRRAYRLSDMVVWLTRGAAVGLGSAALSLVLARVMSVPEWAPLALLLAGLLGGAAVAVTQPHTLLRTALLADHRLALQERLTTAWELQQRGDDVPMVALQLADAAAHLKPVRPYQAFPLRLPPREALASLALLALSVALIALPNPHRLDLQRQQADRALISKQAQAVGQLAQQVQTAAGNQPTPEQAATVQALRDLQQQLKNQSLTVPQALADLAAAEDRLRAVDTSKAAAAKGGLDRAAAALAGGQDGSSPVKNLAQSMGQGQYAAAAAQLQQLSSQAGQMTQQQRDALQASLHAAGAAAAKADPTLGQALETAANSMGSAAEPADAAAQQQAFDQAAGALQQAGQQVTAANQAEQAVSQVQASEAALGNAQQAQGQGQNGQGSQAEAVSSLGYPAPGNGGASAQSGSPSDTAGQQEASGASGATQPSGTGTGAQGQGQQAGQAGAAGGGSGQAGGQGNGGGPSDRVYAPQAANGHQEVVPNAANGPGQQVAANGAENPLANQALVPYNQVIGSYQQQAAQAMDQSPVPLDKKNLVRDYFSALAAGN